MKLILVGGHLSPLLAVIEALPKEIELLVLGRKYVLEGDNALSLEYQTIRSLGIDFIPVTTGRLQRQFIKYMLFSLVKTPIGFFQSLFILRNFKPDAILSFGGYVSLPVDVAALILRIPIVIHEQTTEAGFANKFISLFAKKVCISWESSVKFFPKEKTVLTGNPIRKFEIRNSKFEINKKNIPLIYITGGSSGSHAINILVKGCIEKLLENFLVIHQTGDAKEFRDYDELQKLRETLDREKKEGYMLTKFIETAEVGSILQRTDIVVARSGINTITELIFFGKPALLIPLAYTKKSEQVKNALFFEKIGLGEVEFQDKLSSEKLYIQIVEMIKNINRYKQAASSAKKLVNKDAVEQIISVLKSVVYKA